MAPVRVMTYNLRSLRDDRRAAVRVMRKAQPDVLIIQEAPRLTPWWRLSNYLLARRVGMRLAIGHRWTGGNLILVRPGIKVRDTTTVGLGRDIKNHRRVLVMAVLEVGNQRFLAAGTHLPLDEGGQLRLISLIGSIIGPYEAWILGGDFNGWPHRSTWRALAGLGIDAGKLGGIGRVATYPAKKPSRRLDGVIVSRGIRVVTAQVIDSEDVRRGSDHRPTLFDLVV